MLNFINKLFNKTKKVNKVDDTKNIVNDFFEHHGTANTVDDPDDLGDPVIYGNLKANKTMLLMDDQETVFYLYDLDFEVIKSEFNYDILHEFKIVKCTGPEAGFIASKYIRHCGNEIVVALLDLTLGKIVKLKNGTTILYDGVDIALELIKRQPRCKIGICTAHMLSDSNPVIKHLIEKFSIKTGHNLLDYAFSKNYDRATYIYNMITDIENNVYTDYGSPDAD